MKSDFRLLLTGTPLQNSVDDLLNLLHFISPKKFNQNVNDDLKKKFYESLEEEHDTMSINGAPEEVKTERVSNKGDIIRTIQSLLQPHLLRRLKDDVLNDLPLKREMIIPIELTERQRKIYKCIFKRNFEALSYLDKNSKNKNKVSLKSANNILLYLRLC